MSVSTDPFTKSVALFSVRAALLLMRPPVTVEAPFELSSLSVLPGSSVNLLVPGAELPMSVPFGPPTIIVP